MSAQQSSILLIEDDPTYIQVLSYELKQLGWNVNSVSTLKEAREYLSALQPEIIVSDIYLPDGSGMSLQKN